MNRVTRYVSVFALIIGLFAQGTLSYAQQVSDDDDSYFPEAGETTDVQQNTVKHEETMRVGILKVKPTFEAKQYIPQQLLDKINRYLVTTTNEINASPKIIVPFGKIMSSLSTRNKILYDKCWIDHDCLSIALKPANLDLIVASKIRLVEIAKPGEIADFTDSAVVKTKKDIAAEYTLFIRVIDTKNQKVLKEILVNHTDKNRLPELGVQAYRNSLIELSLIVDDPSMLVSKTKNYGGFDASKIITEENPVYDKNKGLKIAAFTTLGVGIVTEAVALGLGFVSNKMQNDAQNSSSVEQIKSKSDDSKTYALTSNILYGVGGGFIVSSIVLFALGYSEKDYGSGDGEFDIEEPLMPTGGLSITNDGFYIQAQTRF